ncbi:MAG: acyltransferase [Ruminococcaceae bacterium]|nr:acyltransferase [Oscillospiraceae bacterium]
MINQDVQSRQTELSNCNFVKTVLMLVVVLYHSILYWSGDWFIGEPVYAASGLATLAKWMNSFHIYAFALVSGYLFYYLKYEKCKYDKFLPFVFNKVKRLLIPYAFIALVWVIPFAIYYFDYSVWDVVIKFGFGVSPNQLWFLLMLFGVFVIFHPLSNFFAKNNIGGVVLLIAFYGISLVGQRLLPNIFQIFRVCGYITQFWLGFKIRQYGSFYLKKIPMLVWIFVDVVLYAMYCVISEMSGIIFKLLNYGVGFLLHIVGALMAFIVLQKLAEHIKYKNSKLFVFFSKNSMPVYLLHQQVVYVLVYLLNGKINPYIHAGINFIGSMAVSLLIAALLMKFKCTRFLIGEK